MAIKGKAVAALLGVIAVFGIGIAAASAKSPPKKRKVIPSKPAPTPPPSEAVEVEEMAESPDDVIIETPEGATLVVNAKEEAGVEEEVEPVIMAPEEPAPAAPPGVTPPGIVPPPPFEVEVPPTATPVDKKVKEIAAEAGVSEAEVVEEIVETITEGQQPSPLAEAETTPQMDPHGTVSLARLMLAREQMPGWKSDLKEDVSAWQGGVGLKADGFYGINSAGKMAEEVGILPLIRYWPSGTTSKKAGETAYDRRINQTIELLTERLPDSKAHIEALGHSMEREVAVSYGAANPPVQDTADFVQDTTDAIAESAEKRGEKELEANV